MDTISTTQLRTQSTNLVHTLQQGQKVSLIHRSKKVGLIMPASDDTTSAAKTVDAQRLQATLQNITPKKQLTDEQRAENYRTHLIQKYGH